MRKVLIFCNNWYPFIGGVTTHIEQLIHELPDYSFEIVVNAAGDLPSSEEFTSNSKVLRLKPNDLSILHPGYDKLPKSKYPSVLLSALNRARKKNRHMKNSDSDILHFHGPVIEPNFFHLDTRFHTTFFSARIKPSSFPRQKIITCHGLASHYNPDIKHLESKLLRQFDKIICVDKYIVDDAKHLVQDANNIEFVPNSINTNEFSYNELMPDDYLTIGYIGRLSIERGFSLVESLIEKKPKFLKLVLVVAGSEKKVNELQKKYGSNDIKIHANVPPSELPDLIYKMDLLLNPVTYEGSSRATLEAFSCGRPVIMLDIGDRYPLINGENGFLIKNEINELLEIIQSIQNDKGVLKEMSKRARKIIELEFSNDVIIPKIKKIYEELGGYQ